MTETKATISISSQQAGAAAVAYLQYSARARAIRDASNKKAAAEYAANREAKVAEIIAELKGDEHLSFTWPSEKKRAKRANEIYGIRLDAAREIADNFDGFPSWILSRSWRLEGTGILLDVKGFDEAPKIIFNRFNEAAERLRKVAILENAVIIPLDSAEFQVVSAVIELEEAIAAKQQAEQAAKDKAFTEELTARGLIAVKADELASHKAIDGEVLA